MSLIELFESLIFDSGIVGLLVVTFIIIMGISFAVKLKESSLFSIMLFIFLGIEYMIRSNPSGDYIWNALFAFAGALFIGIIAATKFLNEKG